MKRKLSFEDACNRYVHRFTMEYVPFWASQPFGDGQYPAPQYKSDREWYDNTLFNGESEMADKKFCYSSNQSFPIGKTLSKPYQRGIK